MARLTDTNRKLASVQVISKLSPIENADKIEVAELENCGWKIVVRKGEFFLGQRIVYFEVDSAINIKALPPCLRFLREKCSRKLFTGRSPETSAFSEEYVKIKMARLRGVYSQGLIVPLAGIAEILNMSTCAFYEDFPPGSDLTDLLNVEVWDRLEEWYAERSQLGTKSHFARLCSFPSDVPKTDETRLETLTKYFSDPEMTEAEWEITEKNDGSSQTVFFRPQTWEDDPLKISSRNFIMDKSNSPDFTSVFDNVTALDSSGKQVSGLEALEFKLGKIYNGNAVPGLYGHELAIQGEHIGPKFNGNRDRNKEDHFRVFRIYDITTRKFLTPQVRYDVCKFLGLEHVKIIATEKIFHRLHSMADFDNYVKGTTDNGNIREGLVFKKVTDGNVSFKVINKEYILTER